MASEELAVDSPALCVGLAQEAVRHSMPSRATCLNFAYQCWLKLLDSGWLDKKVISRCPKRGLLTSIEQAQHRPSFMS